MRHDTRPPARVAVRRSLTNVRVFFTTRSIAWAVTTIVAWFAILFTGDYPQTLYEFAIDVFRWSTRVEVYLLLLDDAYPPFSFDAH